MMQSVCCDLCLFSFIYLIITNKFMADFYTKYIPNPETIIDQIIASIDGFDDDVYQYAINNFHYANAGKIRVLMYDVMQKRIAIEKEFYRLLDYSQYFNEEFVLEDNKVYHTTLRLFRKLRTSISTTKDLFQKFCPFKHEKIRRFDLYRKKRPNIFDASNLSSKTAKCKDLFDISTYVPVVAELLEEMTHFFDILIQSMHLCKKVIKKEKEIKADSKKCLIIYNKFKEKVLKEMKALYDIMSDEIVSGLKSNNPMAELRDKYGNEEGYAQAGFHNGNVGDARNEVLISAYFIKKHLGLNKYEQAEWGTNVEFVKQIRFAIDHFDELIPAYATRQHLDAYYIVLFAKWCGVSDLQNFIEYFNEIYSKRERSCKSVRYKALNNANNKMVSQNTFDKKYDEFVPVLNLLLDKINIKSPKVYAS